MDHLVLIVDDDPHTLMLWGAVLKPSAVEVIQASDGTQLVSHSRETNADYFAVGHVDALCQRAGCPQLCEQIPQLDNMYVVVISAHRQPDSAPLARANAVLLKPIRPVEIRELLQQAISR